MNDKYMEKFKRFYQGFAWSNFTDLFSKEYWEELDKQIEENMEYGKDSKEVDESEKRSLEKVTSIYTIGIGGG